MMMRGKIRDIQQSYMSRETELSLTVDAKPEDIEKMSGKELNVELKQYRQKRSLDANAYYWVLCGKIADALNTSQAYIHNEMLRKYGQIELVDGQAVYLVIPDTDDAQKRVDEAVTYHIRPTSQVKPGKDGKLYRTYMMLRGSHDYDTKEMSVLIAGIVNEAKELGIETLTPDQIKEMMQAYEKHHAK